MGIVLSMWSCRIAEVLSSLEMQLYYTVTFHQSSYEMDERAGNSQQVLLEAALPSQIWSAPTSPSPSLMATPSGVFGVFF